MDLFVFHSQEMFVRYLGLVAEEERKMFTRELMVEWNDWLAQTYDEALLDKLLGKFVTYVGKGSGGRPDSWTGTVIAWTRMKTIVDKLPGTQYALVTQDLQSHAIHRQANIRYEGEPAPLKEEGIVVEPDAVPAGGDDAVDPGEAQVNGTSGELEPSGSEGTDRSAPSLR